MSADCITGALVEPAGFEPALSCTSSKRLLPVGLRFRVLLKINVCKEAGPRMRGAGLFLRLLASPAGFSSRTPSNSVQVADLTSATPHAYSQGSSSFEFSFPFRVHPHKRIPSESVTPVFANTYQHQPRQCQVTMNAGNCGGGEDVSSLGHVRARDSDRDRNRPLELGRTRHDREEPPEAAPREIPQSSPRFRRGLYLLSSKIDAIIFDIHTHRHFAIMKA